MRAPWHKPWRVEEVDPAIVERLARAHVPHPKAVAMGVDIVGDPHREDNDGYNWTLLSQAWNVADVTPGSTVVIGNVIGGLSRQGGRLGLRGQRHGPDRGARPAAGQPEVGSRRACPQRVTESLRVSASVERRRIPGDPWASPMRRCGPTGAGSSRPIRGGS